MANNRFLIVSILFLVATLASGQEKSVARLWNEALIESIRLDFARPTVHARNLYHLSAMMYDAWAVYEEDYKTVFLNKRVNGFFISSEGLEIPADPQERLRHQEEAMSYAAYRLILHRFDRAPDGNKSEIVNLVRSQMQELGYDPDYAETDYQNSNDPAAFGNHVAESMIEACRRDGSNELFYFNTRYLPQNPPLILSRSGNSNLRDPNRWQPLAFNVFIDQAGNEIPGAIPEFLSPEWGDVDPFALDPDSSVVFLTERGDRYRVYANPPKPPKLTGEGQDEESLLYKWNFALVAVWSSMLDAGIDVTWDISPRSIGNIASLPDRYDEHEDFYDLFGGGDPSQGRDINPFTGEPYVEQIVPRGDYARVLAEFWADGPDSETPPGHWFTIMHEVMDHPEFSRRWAGQGEDMDELEYDLRAFLTLGGAMHDAAIAAWSVKGWNDYIRPVSAIRYMSTVGQSSDETLDNYHPFGIPLIDGYIEVVEDGDPGIESGLFQPGDIKIKAWRGPEFTTERGRKVAAGVDWVRGDYWWPYQQPTFVTPPFAGFVSGHSTFSRAAAEVLTLMTGDEYFPGGIGIFPVPKDEFLKFEKGPSVDMELQWATYRDASDQTSLSRIWGGIHPPVDDIPGRQMGMKIGIDAFAYANTFFADRQTSIYDIPEVTDAFSIYPNPIEKNGKLTIELSDRYDYVNEVRAELFTLSGVQLRAEIVRPGISTLDLFGIPSGVHILHLSTEEIQQTVRITIP
ncbi:MAG: DUF6851 domain-containing protein [Bacteroidota bacterium]